MPCEAAATLTSTSSVRVACVNMSAKFAVLSSLSCSVVYLPLSWKVSPRFGYLRQRNPKLHLFIFCSFKCRMTFEWSFLFLLLCAIPHSSLKMLKCFKMPHQWEHTCLISWKNNLQMCSFNRTISGEFSHLIWSGSKISGSAAELSKPGCTVCSECAQIWLISLFGLLRCGPASHSIGGHFENQGMGMTQQQGVQPEFLLAQLSWEPSGRQRGVRSAVKSPTCLGTWKAWLTIPFEATGCKGAGHWQVTTKMGLIVRQIPQAGVHWTGSYT